MNQLICKFPIVPLNRGLVAYDSDSSELNVELSKLLDREAELNTVIEDLNKKIDATVEFLNNSENRALAEEVDNLSQYLQAMQEIDADTAKFEGLGSDFDFDLDFDDDEEESYEKATSEKESSNNSRRRRAKAIFKTIAKLTHPDKVGHNNLVEIYQEAVDCVSRFDVERLEYLLDLVKSSKSSIKSHRSRSRQRLLQLIQDAKFRIESLESELKSLKDSEEYEYYLVKDSYGEETLLSAHKSDLKAKRHYLRSILTARGIDPDNLV